MSKFNFGYEVSDNSKWPWYFSAPAAVMGDRSSAYGGVMRINFGHRVYNAEGQDRVDAWDVIIEAKGQKCKLGMKSAFGKKYWGRIRAYDIKLVESAWSRIDDSSLLTRDDFIHCLWGITSLKIRGGHFAGAETAVLLRVQFIEGPVSAIAAAGTSV